MHRSVWAIVCKTQLEMGKFMSIWVQMPQDLKFTLRMSPVPTLWGLCLIKYFGFSNYLSPWLPVYLLEQAFENSIIKRQCGSYHVVETDLVWFQVHAENLKNKQQLFSWLADARNLTLWDLFFWMKAFSSLKSKYPQERKHIKLSNI